MTVTEDALAALDHVAARVTLSAGAGLGCGAVYATYKGFPIFRAAISASISCALVGTACFGMERVARGVLSRTPGPADVDDGAALLSKQRLDYGSHALGGMLGGGIVGFLFQGKPAAGALLLTPLMLGVGKIERSLEDHRTARLRQLVEERGQEREG